VLSPKGKPATNDPDAQKRAEQAALMEKAREEERLKLESVDKRFGVTKGVQFSTPHTEPSHSNHSQGGIVSGGETEDQAEKEMSRLTRVLSAKGFKPPPKKSAEELEKERLAWKQQQEAKMLNPNFTPPVR